MVLFLLNPLQENVDSWHSKSFSWCWVSIAFNQDNPDAKYDVFLEWQILLLVEKDVTFGITAWSPPSSSAFQLPFASWDIT